MGRPMLSGDSLLFFLENRSERSGFVLSVDASLGKIRWTQKSSPEWASERPYVARGLIIAGNCRGDLAAFRASDGTPQWKVTIKGCIRSVGDSGDMLFAGVQEGIVYALRY